MGVSVYADDDTPIVFFDLVNQARIAAKVPPLSIDDRAANAAQAYAVAMAERGALSHVDGAGDRVMNRYRAAGGTALGVGEILAVGPTAARIVPAWLASVSHRNVMMNARWTAMGVGVAEGSAGRRVAVVIFSDTIIDDIIVTYAGSGASIAFKPRAGVEGEFVARAPGLPATSVIKSDLGSAVLSSIPVPSIVSITDAAGRGDRVEITFQSGRFGNVPSQNSASD